MGGTLSSPISNRSHHNQPTSVCNHLFASTDGPLYIPRNSHGWSWNRSKNIHPEPRRKDHFSHQNVHYLVKSNTNDEMLSFARPPTLSSAAPHIVNSGYNIAQSDRFMADSRQMYTNATSNSLHSCDNSTEPPAYRRVLDKNDNYKPGNFTQTHSTVIPNKYCMRDELLSTESGRESAGSLFPLSNQNHNSAKLAYRSQDYANNNLVSSSSSPEEEKARTPVSPTHQPITKFNSRNMNEIVDRDRLQYASLCMPPSLLSSSSLSSNSPPVEQAPTVHAPLQIRRRTVLHANTSDLLRGIGRFVAHKTRMDNFEPAHVVMWMRAVDRSLLLQKDEFGALQGWQDVAFINPANLVFVFLLMTDINEDDAWLETSEGVHQWILTCLYVAYSYMGNEISYPLKPFLLQQDRDDFWSKCVHLVVSRSADMLRLNSSSTYFKQVFTELERYARMES